MDAGFCAGAALALTAGAVLLWRYGPRPSPGKHLPPLHRPPVGSNRQVHRRSLAWCDADVEPPPWRHRCWPHSGGWKKTDTGHVWYERCPCGAWREDEGRWHNRNCGRRREDCTPYVDTGFYGDAG